MNILKRIVIFLIVLTCITSSIFAYKYELSIAAIFQNEGPYLKEWIEFHKLAGVEHFYLYNNSSTDNFAEILDPYIQNGEVDLIDWSVSHGNQREFVQVQRDVYNDALQRTKKVSKWLAIIDIDEFIVPTEKDNIVDFLKDFKVFGGVGIRWELYGTSWKHKIPVDQLITENLIHRQDNIPGVQRHVKSIVQPLRVAECQDPHCCTYLDSYYQVDIDRRYFTGSVLTNIPQKSTIRINHYWMRDEDWFENVKVQRFIHYWNNPEIYTEEWFLNEYKINNAIEDTAILKYIPALRKKMNMDD